jgi:phage tail-like protein
MSVVRAEPYMAHNFLVDLGDGTTDTPDGAFAEVSGLETWLEVSEYRTGNEKEANAHKITGLARTADVSLKRGIIGSLRLYQWFNAVRNGEVQLRTVTITLLDEMHKPVQTWKLLRARPVKYVGPTLKANCHEVAMEELVLAYERLEME